MVCKRWDICRSTFSTFAISSRILWMVSLLTLTAISVDRLLALLLGLRYRQVATFRRTYGTVIVLWVVSFVGCITYLWNESLAKLSIYTNIILTLRSTLTRGFSSGCVIIKLKFKTMLQDNPTKQPPST